MKSSSITFYLWLSHGHCRCLVCLIPILFTLACNQVLAQIVISETEFIDSDHPEA
jgi:hypothetical protein